MKGSGNCTVYVPGRKIPAAQRPLSGAARWPKTDSHQPATNSHQLDLHSHQSVAAEIDNHPAQRYTTLITAVEQLRE